MATETKIAKMTESALSVFSKSPKLRVWSPIILMIARAKVPPKSSNTIDTVVEVGIPNELNTSRSTTSVSITARRIHIISEK